MFYWCLYSCLDEWQQGRIFSWRFESRRATIRCQATSVHGYQVFLTISLIYFCGFCAVWIGCFFQYTFMIFFCFVLYWFSYLCEWLRFNSWATSLCLYETCFKHLCFWSDNWNRNLEFLYIKILLHLFPRIHVRNWLESQWPEHGFFFFLMIFKRLWLDCASDYRFPQLDVRLPLYGAWTVIVFGMIFSFKLIKERKLASLLK